MLVLALNGMLEFPFQDLTKYNIFGGHHDSAAVLVDDGKVVAAIEEERLSRIKHTGKAPVYSIQFCLDSYGIKFSDIDRVVFTVREYEADIFIPREYVYNDRKQFRNAKDVFVDIIDRMFGVAFPREKICFVDHHLCHAVSAAYMSGFDKKLVFTIDGTSPETYAGYIIDAKGDAFTILDKIRNEDSLGSLYLDIITVLGYFQHDEYKVMGLAPYGDPGRFRELLKKFYTLLPDGKFQMNQSPYKFFSLYKTISPRLKGEALTQEHKDLAASLQEALETIVLHVLEYYRRTTGQTRLCMSGGVTHNCSMNGKVLYSGLFDEVFVQPAAHDAGNALGGALYVSKALNPRLEMQKLKHLYWGSNIKDSGSIRALLAEWDAFVTFKKEEDITAVTARLLADGNVIGWVQGRSEFGPRALGNRSILADPRPAENKRIINAMVKKREAYRPFAPSVLEEYLGEYYELPRCQAPLDYMNFVLKTRKEKYEVLGAVTHVDGTARVQSVCRAANEKYWNLIEEFRKLTGIPILLNTSFNNNVEPIVDSEEDALVSFLTTRIHYLVIGDYLVSKKQAGNRDFKGMVVTRPVNSELESLMHHPDQGATYRIRLHLGNKYSADITRDVFTLLENAGGVKTLAELLDENGIAESEEDCIIEEIQRLWSLRLIKLKPRGAC